MSSSLSDMAGQPTKRTPEVETRLLEALNGGSTIRDACGYAGIHKDTFYEWKKQYSDFSDAVTRAESECAVRNGAILQKAANGYDTVEVRTTEKIAYRERTLRHPDGTVEEIKEPVPYTEVVTTRGREFDWRASLEWLKRRRKEEWSERQELQAEIETRDTATRESLKRKLVSLPASGDAGEVP